MVGDFIIGLFLGALLSFVSLFGSIDIHRKIIDQAEMLCQEANSTTRSVDWFEATCENNAVIPIPQEYNMSKIFEVAALIYDNVDDYPFSGGGTCV